MAAARSFSFLLFFTLLPALLAYLVCVYAPVYLSMMPTMKISWLISRKIYPKTGGERVGRYLPLPKGQGSGSSFRFCRFTEISPDRG